MTTPPKPTRTRPSITIDLPAGWFFKESYTLLEPTGRANVIVSSEPLDPAITAREYAETQGGLLAGEFPGYEPLGDIQPWRVRGVAEAWLREFSWRPEGSDPVCQIQAYTVRRGRGFTATATTTRAEMWDHRRVLTDVLRSIAVDPGAADAMAATQPAADAVTSTDRPAAGAELSR
ncbi:MULTISPECIES: DcrB-related protein [unclassified Saccharothrix]|uniref:DcrB-related protein n=1 Tax=unclassified Saccharothrix TaxID=2593673 RepID=UPI00307D29C0